MASEDDELLLNFTSANSWDNSNVSVKKSSSWWQHKENVSASRPFTYTVSSNDIFEGSITFKFDSQGFIEGCTVPPYFTNTTPDEPTYSEFVDTSWTKTVTLPTDAGAWSTTVKDLIQEDENGNRYRYYLTEDSCTPEASNTVFKDDIGNGTEHTINTSGQKVEVTNTYENHNTSLTVQKRWQSNHTTWNPSYGEDLRIYFKLYKVKGDQKEQVNSTIYQLTKDTKVNVAESDLGGDTDLVKENFTQNADGSYSIPFMITISDLPVLEDGWQYVVVECNASGKEFEQGENKTFWTCLEFNNATTAIKNDLTDVKATKIWVDQSITGMTHPEVTFLLYRTTDTIPDNSWENETGYDHLENINWGNSIDTKTIAAGATGDALTAKWTDLPKYDITTGELYTYYVKESTVEGYTLNSRGLEGGNKYWFTFENKLVDKTAFEFSKIWNDIGSQPTTWPTGATITVTMNAYTDTSQKAIDDVQVTLSADGSAAGVTPAWTATTSSDGKKTTFKVEGLAKYSSDGKELTYYVTETQVDGYKAPSYATSEGNGLVFTGSDVPKATDGQQIINTPEGGYELPSTGGMGTTLFTALGGLMTATAGAILTLTAHRRRKQHA